MPVCRKCHVSGHVQGVFFRVTAAMKARDLGVTGSAINLSDGCVEVIACGEEEVVAAFCEWLQQGPRAARVTDVSCETIGLEPPLDFRIG